MRASTLERNTNETKIRVALCLDGEGNAEVETGIGFFDHMLDHLGRHSGVDLTVKADGDLEIDAHHTVEDVGICLGQAFREALGTPVGIRRFGSALVPMDEALAEVAIDVSGRPFLVFNAEIPRGAVGGFDTELAEEFFRAFAMNARITLHINLKYGGNAHHCIEVIFKAFARALADAVTLDPKVKGVPSTKGMLET